MSRDPWDHPDARRWRARADRELKPMVANSAVAMMLWNPEPDAKMAVELGFILLLGKPLVIAKPVGEDIPPHLARLAEAIIEFEPGNMGEDLGRRIAEVSERIARRGDARQPTGGLVHLDLDAGRAILDAAEALEGQLGVAGERWEHPWEAYTEDADLLGTEEGYRAAITRARVMVAEALDVS